MSIAVRPAASRTRSVRCPDCHAPRTVSLEQAIRIAKGVHSAKCQLCRNPPKRVPITEQHRRYWLIQGGVPKQEITRAGGSLEYVKQYGVPQALQPVVAGASYFTG